MKVIKYLSIFLKSLTHKKISYSYGGIDSLINNIFKNNNKGFYVDIGCGHPIKNNNTYLLNKKGWYGINIDLDNDGKTDFIIQIPTPPNNEMGDSSGLFLSSKADSEIIREIILI